jgi:hypothetical protein
MTLIDRLEELLAKSTPGPWRLAGVGDEIVGANGKTLLLTMGEDPCFRLNEDAELIVLAIIALPKLIALARAAGNHQARAYSVNFTDEEENKWVQAQVALHDALAALNKDPP